MKIRTLTYHDYALMCARRYLVRHLQAVHASQLTADELYAHTVETVRLARLVVTLG